MKLHEIKQTLLANKFYVYNLSTHAVVSGPYDERLHALNSPEMVGSIEKHGTLVARLGKDIKSVNEARLHDIVLKDIDLWDHAGLPSIDLEIEFDYEPPVSQRHPYGEGSATEHLGAIVDIASIRAAKEANIYDDDEKVVRVLAKGADITKEPFFRKKDFDTLADQVAEKME